MALLPPPLSAKNEKYVSGCLFVIDLFSVLLRHRSFAYETIKDRLPLIVTRIVDFLARHRATIAQEHGEVSVPCLFSTGADLIRLSS